MSQLSHIRLPNRPPTIVERTALQAMIENEKACLKVLEENKNHYRMALQKAQISISMQKNVSSQAKLRLELAVSLHHGLQQSVDTMLATIKHPDELDIPIVTDNPNVQIIAIRQLLQARDETVNRLNQDLAAATDSIRDAREAAALSDEELQGALAVEKLSLEGLAQCSAQVDLTKSSLQSKMDRFRPIWRVPEDVWITVFKLLTDKDLFYYSLQSWRNAIGVRGPWHQIVVLQGVCYRWRTIIRTTPSFWQCPLIVNGSTSLGRRKLLDDCLAMCNGTLETLTLTGINDEDATDDQLQLENVSLDTISVINQLRCDLSTVSGTMFRTWLLSSPPIREIIIIDFSNATDTCSLPNHICASIEKCIAVGFWIDFGTQTPRLKQLGIVHTKKKGISAQKLHRLLERNGATVQKLAFAAKIFRKGNPTPSRRNSLDNLHEITCTFTFLEELGRRHDLPALRKFGVVPPIPTQIEAWVQLLSHPNQRCATTIQEVTLLSMDLEEIRKVIPFMNYLLAIKVLDLNGDSVEPVLQARIDALSSQDGNAPTTLSCLSALEKLNIEDYNGSGEVVLEFIKATRADHIRKITGAGGATPIPESGTPSDQHPLFKLNLNNCPNISNEMQGRITAALHQK